MPKVKMGGSGGGSKVKSGGTMTARPPKSGKTK